MVKEVNVSFNFRKTGKSVFIDENSKQTTFDDDTIFSELKKHCFADDKAKTLFCFVDKSSLGIQTRIFSCHFPKGS